MKLFEAAGRRLDRIPRVPVAVFLVALLARVLFRIETRGDPYFSVLVTDARSYLELGRRFAAGDFLFGKDPLWFAPFYPTLLGGIFRLFGPQLELVRALQHVAGAATAALTADLARRLAPGAGWVAGLLVALSPVLLFSESQLLFTSWAVFFTALFLHRFAAGLDRPSAPRAGEAGALLGVLGWVRANSLLFLPVGAWLLRRRGGARAGLIFLAAGLATLVPVLLRNGVVSGAWTPLTVNGGFIFAEGFREGALGGRTLSRSPDDFGPRGAYQREAEQRAGRSLSLAEASDLERRWTLERMRQDPVGLVRVTLRKLDLLLNVREIDDNLGIEAVTGRSRVLDAMPGPWAWALIPAVVGGAVTIRRRSEVARALGIYALVQAASLLPFFVTSRYRLPLLVPLAALAGLGVVETARAIREERTRFVAAAALLALATAAAVVLHDHGLRPSEPTRLVALGAAFQDAGRSAEALDLTERAIRLGDRSAAAYQNRALILLSLGRLPEALRSAEIALTRQPDLAPAWNTRGTILARSGRFEEALPCFRRAVALDPSDESARANFALARQEIEGRRPPSLAVPPASP
ncbi:MAG: tetratricopeptide repeat protein [bacterium]